MRRFFHKIIEGELPIVQGWYYEELARKRPDIVTKEKYIQLIETYKLKAKRCIEKKEIDEELLCFALIDLEKYEIDIPVKKGDYESLEVKKEYLEKLEKLRKKYCSLEIINVDNLIELYKKMIWKHNHRDI